MNKKHKSRQNKKHVEAKKTALQSPEGVQALECAVIADLQAGQAKLALERLKEARSLAVAVPQADLLKHCAYCLRAAALSEATLHKEAAVMQSLADSSVPTDAVLQTLPVAGFMLFLRYTTFSRALRAATLRPEVDSRRLLVDRAVMENSWPEPAELGIDHPLSELWPQLKNAARAMQLASWKEAEAALASVPRRSPAAAWRVLCKAVLAWDDGDAEAVARCLALLPNDFALLGAVRQMHAQRSAPAPAQSKREQQIRDLLRDLRKRGTTATDRCIGNFVASLPNGTRWTADVLELLAADARTGGLPVETLQRAVRSLGQPQFQSPQFGAKLGFLAANLFDYEVPWGILANYIDTLKAEPLMRARVLEYLARELQKAEPDEFDKELGTEVLGGILPRQLTHADHLYAGLMMQSLRDDPGNFEGATYFLRLVGELSQPHTLPGVEDILSDLANRFCKETAPLVYLNRICRAKKSFRQAEQAIVEARRRAPHEAHILDQHAASLLLTAKREAKANNPVAAMASLQEAEALKRPDLFELSEATRLFCGLQVQEMPVQQAVTQTILGMSPYRAARLLMLVNECLDKETAATRQQVKFISQTIKKLLTNTAAVSSRDALTALKPIPAKYIDVGGIIFSTCLPPLWPTLLKSVNDDDLLPAYDVVLSVDGHFAVLEDVRRRLNRRGRRPKLYPELFLYSEAVLGMYGGRVDVHALQEFVDAAEPAVRQRLAAAGQRLAAFDKQAWGQALRELRFSNLRCLALEDLDEDEMEIIKNSPLMPLFQGM